MMLRCSPRKQLTRGVRVHVQSEYAPDRSRPGRKEWFFIYTVKISNEAPNRCSW